jgi:ribosomal protein S18 acetylase RimI-like enzyme
MATAIRPYQERDRDSLVALWASCDLTRAWNDPGRDIDRKLANDAQNLLVIERAGDIIGSVMVGYDGHRGWINYLAVHPSHQRQGFARQLTVEAERRLREVGCAKVNLQVRSSNARAHDFFSRIGYVPDAVVSLGKRLEVDE